jgi:putative transcription factor
MGGMMQECELCGKRTDDAFLVSVEEVELRVCAKCAKGKHVIAEVSQDRVKRHGSTSSYMREKENEKQIIENYGSVIRNARERMRIPVRVLAEMLNEKEGMLSRVEQQKTLPPEDLIKKLEKTLNIKLEESGPQEPSAQRVQAKAGAATLGEFVG